MAKPSMGTRKDRRLKRNKYLPKRKTTNTKKRRVRY